MASEKRRSSRRTAPVPIRVNYVDINGASRCETVDARDISPDGCRVVLRSPAPHRSVVHLQMPEMRKASATVRYQTASPRGYVTGLEFLGGFSLDTAAAIHAGAAV